MRWGVSAFRLLVQRHASMSMRELLVVLRLPAGLAACRLCWQLSVAHAPLVRCPCCLACQAAVMQHCMAAVPVPTPHCASARMLSQNTPLATPHCTLWKLDMFPKQRLQQ